MFLSLNKYIYIYTHIAVCSHFCAALSLRFVFIVWVFEPFLHWFKHELQITVKLNLFIHVHRRFSLLLFFSGNTNNYQAEQCPKYSCFKMTLIWKMSFLDSVSLLLPFYKFQTTDRHCNIYRFSIKWSFFWTLNWNILLWKPHKVPPKNPNWFRARQRGHKVFCIVTIPHFSIRFVSFQSNECPVVSEKISFHKKLSLIKRILSGETWIPLRLCRDETKLVQLICRPTLCMCAESDWTEETTFVCADATQSHTVVTNGRVHT